MTRQRLKLGERFFQVDMLARQPLAVRIVEGENEREWSASHELKTGAGRISIDGRYRTYFVSEDRNAVWVSIDGRTLVLEKSKARAAAEDQHGGFQAPMPGKVIKVAVQDGAEVAAGQVLVVMEAMKMEHRIEAPVAGVVQQLHCQVGDMVEGGFNLLDFEAAT